MAAVAMLMAAALAGCASSLTELPIVGEPANMPRAAAEAPAYLAVHDMPPARSEPVLNSADQARVQNDLIAARDKQSAAVTAEAERDAKQSQAAAKSAKTRSKTATKTTAKATKQAQSGSNAKTPNNAAQQ